MRRKIWTIVIAVLIVISAIFFVLSKKPEDYGERCDSVSFRINQRVWASNGEVKTEFQIEYAKSGDMIYHVGDYKLYISAIYEDAVILTQEGGLMPENKDGSFNALSSPDDYYIVYRGEELRLRSYSLYSGVSVGINIENIK